MLWRRDRQVKRASLFLKVNQGIVISCGNKAFHFSLASEVLFRQHEILEQIDFLQPHSLDCGALKTKQEFSLFLENSIAVHSVD